MDCGSTTFGLGEEIQSPTGLFINFVAVQRILSYVLLAILINMFIYLDTDTSRLQNITRAASPGDTVLLPCLLNATNKDWQYQRQDNDGYDSITHNGVVTSKFVERFQLDVQGLLIRNVQTEDQGTYACIDQQQHRTGRIRLFVPCKSTFYCS